MEAATAAPAESSAPAPSIAAPGTHWLQIGSRRVQVVGPSIRDPRIHLSLTILTIITIGTVWLGFQLSIPQIVVTVVACGVTEAAYLFRRTGRLVWPASAFQTATSTVLLFRVIGTEARGYSTFHGVALFVAVALAGLATKYFVRFRGGHVFNPSNVALVAAFLVLGSNRVEPLDFWWAPIGPAMIAAYVVIFAGGLFICGRLHLLAMGLTFWITLAVGMGILAALGHTITTRWSLTPIGGAHFWWIIMTSPEIFIFLFFMITDPKTVPSGRVARVVFGFSIGVAASLLMAPWDTEFGVKVGLLSGLVVMCAVRPFAERFFPVAGSDDDRLGVWLGGLLAAPSPDGSGRRHAFARVAVASVGMLAFGGGVAAAGLPNTEPASTGAATVLTQPTTAGALSDIDPASLPTVTIDRRVRALSASLADQGGAQELAATLLWNLRVEAEAVATGDASLLPAVTDGQRLHDITDQITTAGPDGPRVASAFTFDGLHLQIVYPGGLQRGANAGFVATGTVVETTYAPDGTVTSSTGHPFATTFSMRQTTNGHWLTTDTLAPGE